MRSSVAAILLALCLTAPAVGQETNEARVDTPPEWVNRPTREDLVAVFPGSRRNPLDPVSAPVVGDVSRTDEVPV